MPWSGAPWRVGGETARRAGGGLSQAGSRTGGMGGGGGGGGGVRNAGGRRGGKTGVNVSVLVGDSTAVAQVCGAEEAPAAVPPSVLQEVLQVMQRLGRSIDRPVLPELPPPIKLAGPLQITH